MAHENQPSKTKRTAHPLKSHTLRVKFLEELKRQSGEAIAFGANIIMCTGMRPCDAIKLRYEDIPADGIMKIKNTFDKGSDYMVTLPPQVMTIYHHLLNQHDKTEYIFQPYAKINDKNPAPIDAQTFARKMKYALEAADITAEEGGMYVPLSLQRTFFYDIYMKHGVEHTNKLIGFSYTYKVYKYLNVEPDKNPSWADASNYSPIEKCSSELSRCHRLLRYVDNLLDAPRDNIFYQVCAEELQIANVALEVILQNAPQEGSSSQRPLQ